MPNTSALPAISLDDLASVTGGCGKKKCCPPPQPQQADAPAPSAAPSGPAVSTNVSITGYGAA
jgi:hypothetical protein